MTKSHAELGGLDRRTFLKASVGASTLLGAPFLGLRAGFADESGPRSVTNRNKAKHVIVLYMRGGASHIDTFDPKPGQETGGPFKAIQTAAAGMQISEHLPMLAKQAKHFSLIRSINSKEGSHERAMYQNTTGYVPAGPVKHPDLGAVVACECGKKDFDLPSFVSIGGSTVNGGGFLGVEYAPFIVNDPGKLPNNLAYPKGVDSRRFKRRWTLLRAIEKTFGKGRSAALINGHKNMLQKATDFMHSPRIQAFDLENEPKKSRERYGNSRFGRGALVARRLVEVGVPFIQVNLGGWDTHNDNFNRVSQISKAMDPAMASLFEDLADRDLLKDTLVLWIGDFGRTPRINKTNGRDHYPRAWSVLLGGGGVQGGRVIGATDKTGSNVVKDQKTPQDIFATMGHCLGLDLKKENFSDAGRPIQIINSKGKVIKDLIT